MAQASIDGKQPHVQSGMSGRPCRQHCKHANTCGCTAKSDCNIWPTGQEKPSGKQMDAVAVWCWKACPWLPPGPC